MVKLKISYDDKEELKRFLEVINPYISNLKTDKGDKGSYRKAYANVKKINKNQNLKK